MKILILGSVALPVPPIMQGGTERIAYWQAIGLAKRGYDITLVASKGSKKDPSYTLVEIGGGDTVVGSQSSVVTRLQAPERSDGGQGRQSSETYTEGSRNLRKELVYMAQVSQWLLDHGKDFDVILNNMRGGESILLPIAKLLNLRLVTVMHLPIFTELAELFMRYQTPVITISNAQRIGFPDLNFVGTVYNATDLDELPFCATPEDYLVMMGSIAPHKNQKDSILAAKALGKKIVIAGKIGNQAYWDKEIAPLVDGEMVEHCGEMSINEKAKLLGGAAALLFPIVWPEPFGLVMIEAMACGTPVIAYNNGAVPEVVRDGVTGLIVDEKKGVAGLVEAIKRVDSINRRACRRHVEEHFTIEKMIESLEAAIQTIK